jgi:hypothetical protein
LVATFEVVLDGSADQFGDGVGPRPAGFDEESLRTCTGCRPGRRCGRSPGCCRSVRRSARSTVDVPVVSA